MNNRQLSKKERRREELRRREEVQRRARIRRNVWIGVIIAGIVALVATYVIAVHPISNTGPTSNANTVSNTNPSSTNSSTNTTGQPNAALDNIKCDSTEQLNYHQHAQLSIYINGKAVPVSQNIGIAGDGSCYYWLHTHDTTGVIHMEAPAQQTFTLGTFVRLWKEQFSQLQYPSQLDSSNGWQVYVNGKPFNGDFRTVTLTPHELIMLAYNSPDAKPITQFNWGGQ